MKRHSDVKMTWRWNTYISLAENAYDVIMSSPFVQFFKIIYLSSSYDRLPDHNKFGLICIKESKVVEGGEGLIPPPPKGWECIKSPRWWLSFSSMPWSSYGCDGHRYSYFTRSICNWCVDSLWSIFGSILCVCYDYMDTRPRSTSNSISQASHQSVRAQTTVFLPQTWSPISNCYYTWLQVPILPLKFNDLDWWSYGSEINAVVNSCTQFCLWS